MADYLGTMKDFESFYICVVEAQSSDKWDGLSFAAKDMITKIQGLDFHRGVMLNWCTWCLERCHRRARANLPAYPDALGKQSVRAGGYPIPAPEVQRLVERRKINAGDLRYKKEILTTQFPTLYRFTRGYHSRRPDISE